jgi:alpha-tubulin suppressor-like RCC1 family protein
MPRTRRTVIATLLAAVALLVPAGRAEAGGDPQLEDLAQVDIGDQHACARTTDGRVWCWGRNHVGQLGNDQPDDSTVPVRVLTVLGNPLTRVTSISVGASQTCAVLTNHQARCWGSNFSRELGNPGVGDVARHAVTVLNSAGTGPLTGVARISAGQNFTCAVLTNGQARCWGSSTFGQTGTGSHMEVPRPRAVLALSGNTPLTGVAGVAAGSAHACAVLRNHEARCWGQNLDHETGSAGNIPFVYRPRRVLNRTGTAPFTGVRAIAVGSQSSCAVLLNSQVRCWGLDHLGELGNGPNGDSAFPAVVVDVDGVGRLTGADRIASGGFHSCVVVTGRQVRCWGDNAAGDLGNDDPDNASQLPVITLGLGASPQIRTVTQIGASPAHTCVRVASGRARCWGNNDTGELGNQFPGDAARPVPVIAPL